MALGVENVEPIVTLEIDEEGRRMGKGMLRIDCMTLQMEFKLSWQELILAVG